MNNYAEFVKSRAKKPDDIHLDGRKKDLMHMIFGVSGEVGELLDAIKKHIIYGHRLDIDNVVEELGDIEFYLQGLRNNLGLNRDMIIDRNVSKLSIRYENGYTDDAAKQRKDKQ